MTETNNPEKPDGKPKDSRYTLAITEDGNVERIPYQPNGSEIKCSLHGDEVNVRGSCARCDANFWEQEVDDLKHFLSRISSAHTIEAVEAIIKEWEGY